MSLQNRWTQLMAHFSLDFNQTETQFAAITQAHSEKHRVYHNLTHLAHFFDELDQVPSVSPEMLLAVWYHDFVYKPGSKNNEHKSAKIAVKTLNQLGIDAAVGHRVAELIEATQSHQNGRDDIQISYFLDGDMAILGSPTEQYRQYAAAIRQEHRKYPDFLYKLGRKKFLQQTLAGEHIFLTESFQQRYEQQARRNLQAEWVGL